MTHYRAQGYGLRSGHPLTMQTEFPIEMLRRTGSPAFAGDDNIENYGRKRDTKKLLSPPPDEREHRALRVLGLHDPTAPWHFHWTVGNLAAANLQALDRRVEVAHIEVVKPEGDGHHRRLVEHAADRRPAGGKHLVSAHGAHIHRVAFLPSE